MLKCAGKIEAWFLVVGTCFWREGCSCRNPPLGVRWKTRHCWKRRISSGGASLMHTSCFAVGKVKTWLKEGLVYSLLWNCSLLSYVLHWGFSWQGSKGWACCLRFRSFFPVLSISELPFLGAVLLLRFRTISRCCRKLCGRAVSSTNSWTQGMQGGYRNIWEKCVCEGRQYQACPDPLGHCRLTRTRAQHFKPSPCLC